MPFEIKFDKLPAGYLASVNEDGEAEVIVREFVSSEDGDLFISRLEGFPTQIVSMLPYEAGISPGQIHHMLMILRRDKTATVYVNELKLISVIRFGGRIRSSVKVGEPIYEDDILDIEKLSPEGVIIPEDAGFLFIFSAGWRKGLFYDFLPITDTENIRTYDIDTTLGRYFAYLNFQHLFKLSENDWKLLFDQQWFPFVSLKTATCKQLLKNVKHQQQVDNLLGKIASEVKELSDNMLTRWKSSSYISPNYNLLQQAMNRYLEEDFISATSIIYPQIEGVMRRVYYASNPPKRVKASKLATHTVQSRPGGDNEHSLLLPLKFSQYLQDVYFANFDPNQPAAMSRNSLAHGVADPEDYSLKAATIGILTLDQIFYFLPEQDKDTT